MPPNNVLIIFAHPAFQRSVVNRHLVRAVRGMESVTFHDLYENYPDFLIDTEEEQRLLMAHDVIVFQHPLFWYSTPAILKEWQDLVLQHGWAYGSEGNALRGKTVLQVTTTGGSEDAYCQGGSNCHTMRQLLAPFEQTCILCGMNYLAPFVVHGTHALNTEEDMLHHCQDYRRVVAGLRDGTVDLSRAKSANRINLRLDQFMREGATNG